jgi:hypothetical protein
VLLQFVDHRKQLDSFGTGSEYDKDLGKFSHGQTLGLLILNSY